MESTCFTKSSIGPEQIVRFQKETVKKTIIATIDSAIHDFLFALQEINDIQILVDGKIIVELSDGIHAEAYSEEGWNAKYSKFETFS